MAPDKLRDLYSAMLRLRVIEEGIAALYGEQEMRCPTHLSIGQEGTPVGIADHLRADDYAFSTHRSHGHYLAMGGDLKAMLAELYGKATGCCAGKGGSMHLTDRAAGFVGATPVVGATIPIAVGAALKLQLSGDEGRVAVAFFGDGAVEEGAFHEAANFAAVRKLPIVFCCENNLYSVYSPLRVRQPEGRRIVDLVRGYGLACWSGDGNDVREVHALAGEAVALSRGGGGPSFLEFATYRWRAHCGPKWDNDIGYRTEAEYQSWRERCPLEHARGLLGLSDAEHQALVDQHEAEFQAAVAFAKQSPFPAHDRLLQEVYAS